MKALVYTAPQTLDYRDAEDVRPAAGAVTVQIESAGICGSDMHAWMGHDDRRPAPLVLGHEVAGRRADTGARVTVNPLVTCGACQFCSAGRDNLCVERQIISMPPRQGGFAEALAMPTRNLVALPAALSCDQAALAEPIACGWHAARLAREAQDTPKTALVIGGGAIGVGAALSLIAQGGTEVTLVESNPMRRAYLGARCAFATAAEAPGDSAGSVDVVIDAVGLEATRATASAHVRPGGVIAHIGLGSAEGGLDLRRMTLHEITFVGTYTYTAQDFRDTVDAMVAGRLGALDWTECRPLAEGAHAFADLRAGRVAAPKIILKP